MVLSKTVGHAQADREFIGSTIVEFLNNSNFSSSPWLRPGAAGDHIILATYAARSEVCCHGYSIRLASSFFALASSFRRVELRFFPARLI